MRNATLDIVGCGAVATQFHLPAVQWLEEHGFANVRYCIDPNLSAASALARRFRHARPVSAASPLDIDSSAAAIALVATPPEFHCEWAQHYLEAGAGVLIEKPAVMTTREFSLLENTSNARKQPVLAGQVRRLFPSARAARDAVMADEIGPVRRIEAFEGYRWSWMTHSDYPVRSKAGGVLYAYGPHALDTALFICGIDDLAADDAAVRMERIERWPASEPAHDVRAEMGLRMRGFDVSVMLHLSRTEQLANLVRVQGDDGELLVPADYAASALLRKGRQSRRLDGGADLSGAASLAGCFLAEHMEMWRVWSGAGGESPLALEHFGLLTYLLESLAGGG